MMFFKRSTKEDNYCIEYWEKINLSLKCNWTSGFKRIYERDNNSLMRYKTAFFEIKIQTQRSPNLILQKLLNIQFDFNVLYFYFKQYHRQIQWTQTVLIVIMNYWKCSKLWLSAVLPLSPIPLGIEKTSDVRSSLLSLISSAEHRTSSGLEVPNNKDIVNHIAIAKNYIRKYKHDIQRAPLKGIRANVISWLMGSNLSWLTSPKLLFHA